MNPNETLPYNPNVSIHEFIQTTHGPPASPILDPETTFNNYIQSPGGFFYIFGPLFDLQCKERDPPELRQIFQELAAFQKQGDKEIGLYLAANGTTNFRLHREMGRLWAINVNIAGGNKVDN